MKKKKSHPDLIVENTSHQMWTKPTIYIPIFDSLNLHKDLLCIYTNRHTQKKSILEEKFNLYSVSLNFSCLTIYKSYNEIKSIFTNH